MLLLVAALCAGCALAAADAVGPAASAGSQLVSGTILQGSGSQREERWQAGGSNLARPCDARILELAARCQALQLAVTTPQQALCARRQSPSLKPHPTPPPPLPPLPRRPPAPRAASSKPSILLAARVRSQTAV